MGMKRRYNEDKETKKRNKTTKRRQTKKTHKLLKNSKVGKKRDGAKTDREYDQDFMNQRDSDSFLDDKRSDKSMSEECMEVDMKKFNEGIEANIKKTYVVPDGMLDDNIAQESDDLSDDIDIKSKPARKRKAKGKVQKEKVSYKPITSFDAATQPDKIKFDDAFDYLLHKVQLNFIPSSLPCRDKEKDTISDFIESGLRNHGSSTSLYISGMPGTGKTATTLEVIRNLNEERSKKFKFIHMNGMQLNNASIMYSLIYKEITGIKLKPTSAAVALDDYFKKKKNISAQRLKSEQMIVLLVDELDALVTKKQTLLYNLFDWPSNKNSGLIILAIANTMDLPERFLVKIKSRIGESRLVYQPYNRDQITEILTARLSENKDMFKKDAITVVSSKVSAICGDIRRALQASKRAIEMAKLDYYKNKRSAEPKPITDFAVNISYVQKAFIELYHSKNALLLKALRKYERVVIVSVMIEREKAGQEKVKQESIVNRITSINESLGYDRLERSEIIEILLRLKAFGIVAITNEKPKLDNIHVEPFVYPEDIVIAYENEEELFKQFRDHITST